MIILISFSMICFVAYAVWVISALSDVFNGAVLGLFASLFAILMPPAIIIQILIYMEVIKTI